MSKISLGQLDLEALQQYLEIIVGFRKATDRAFDVSNVAEMPAEIIAVAARDEEGNLIEYIDEEGNIILEGRETVQNALMLGGVDAGEYLKKIESDTILTDVNTATYNISEDIQNVKDELYQLKNQLVKSGVLKDSVVYNGYIDSFVDTNMKHNFYPCAIIQTASGVLLNVDNPSSLTVGEYIAVKGDKHLEIRRVEEINGFEIRIDEPIVIQGDPNIYKSIGESGDGKFVFAYVPENNKVQTAESKLIVKDGTDRVKVFELNFDNSGFGTEFVVPSSLENNLLTKLQISLAKKGNPGTITGHIYKYDAKNEQWNELTEYKTESISHLGISSWFGNQVFRLNKELELVPGEKYIILFSTNYASDDDKWYIGGFTEDDCSMEVHDDCYIFDGMNLHPSIDDKDMYLTIYTKEIAESYLDRLPYGLYTCEFDCYNSTATRIRAELTINKEGMFNIKKDINTNFAKAEYSQIPIANVKNIEFPDKVFDKGDILVSGNQISRVASSSDNNYLIPADNMFIAGDAPIYRVGYELQVKVANKQQVIRDNMFVTEYNDVQIYPLQLIGVVPGKDIIRPDESSDRLLFECDFLSEDENNIKLKSFNYVELQVKWNGHIINSNAMNLYTELEGSIFDIAVSIDQAYTKKVK